MLTRTQTDSDARRLVTGTALSRRFLNEFACDTAAYLQEPEGIGKLWILSPVVAAANSGAGVRQYT